MPMNKRKTYRKLPDVPTSPYLTPGLLKHDYTSKLGDTILKALCRRYEVHYGDVIGRGRLTKLVYIRQLFCYWIYKYFDGTVVLKKIGSRINGRDYTTVLHSINTYQDMLYTDATLAFPVDWATTYKEDYLQTSKYLQQCLSELQAE